MPMHLLFLRARMNMKHIYTTKLIAHIASGINLLFGSTCATTCILQFTPTATTVISMLLHGSVLSDVVVCGPQDEQESMPIKAPHFGQVISSVPLELRGGLL